jgi:hypothetical protein
MIFFYFLKKSFLRSAHQNNLKTKKKLAKKKRILKEIGFNRILKHVLDLFDSMITFCLPDRRNHREIAAQYANHLTK